MSTRLRQLNVSGLRCLDGLHLTFDRLTALIGPNGVGKSSTLRALQFLFGTVELDDHDCANGDTDTEITVTATFTDLPQPWIERLQPWLDDDNDLTITRSRTADGQGRPKLRYTTTRRQAPGFGAVRDALQDGKLVPELKSLWLAAQQANEGQLPPWPNKAAAHQTLIDFEGSNPGRVTEPSSDSTLGFGAAAVIDLGEMIELLVLPALRDASSDATDARGSTLTRLVDLTVRSGMDLDQKLADLSTRTNESYRKLVDEAGGAGLARLAELITNQLNSFAPGSKVQLSWDPRMPTLAPPPVKATIIESEHEADIGRQGHGVQRAYVFSLLRALLEARRGDGSIRPGLVLAIEEPEVYQHPIRARYVSNVLTGLAYATDSSTQVVFTTHSPLFVSVERIESVRQLRLKAAPHPSEPDSVDSAADNNQSALPFADGAGACDGACDGAAVDDTAYDRQAPEPQGSAPGPHSNGVPDNGGAQGSDAPDQDDHDGDVVDPQQLAATSRNPLTANPASRARTRATAPTLKAIAMRLESARAGRGQTWTTERVAAQLPGLLGTTLSEGFFADRVVLVEGEEDFGFIHGAAEANGVDLYELGTAVIAVGGKDRLLLAHEVFRASAIPAFVVYDTDISAAGKQDPGTLMSNNMISKLTEGRTHERPPTQVNTNSASAHPNLRAVVEHEVGHGTVQATFAATLASMGLSAQAAKNGHLVRAVILDIYAAGHRSNSLDAIVRAICA